MGIVSLSISLSRLLPKTKLKCQAGSKFGKLKASHIIVIIKLPQASSLYLARLGAEGRKVAFSRFRPALCSTKARNLAYSFWFLLLLSQSEALTFSPGSLLNVAHPFT